jgi:type II secretory ATPase GspE/PulE/Tfp pilus assembly ATPase PilB-like protein
MERTAAGKIREVAVQQGMQTLRENAWNRVIAGETSLEELIRVCPIDND